MNDKYHIPKNIFQISQSKKLPEKLYQSTKRLREMNPNWTYKLVDDIDALNIIKTQFDDRVINAYLRISDDYGVVRADLLRYLLIWKFGGAYFDLKSGTSIALDQIIDVNDQLILSQREDAYLHRELKSTIIGGEFEQWHVISRPGHPILEAVIQQVLTNIERYTPTKGVGKKGVLRLSGPIVYTKTIVPLITKNTNLPYRKIISGREGLHYTILENVHAHIALNPSHYSHKNTPIITPSETRGFSSMLVWNVQAVLIFMVAMIKHANHKRVDRYRERRKRRGHGQSSLKL